MVLGYHEKLAIDGIGISWQLKYLYKKYKIAVICVLWCEFKRLDLSNKWHLESILVELYI